MLLLKELIPNISENPADKARFNLSRSLVLVTVAVITIAVIAILAVTTTLRGLCRICR